MGNEETSNLRNPRFGSFTKITMIMVAGAQYGCASTWVNSVNTSFSAMTNNWNSIPALNVAKPIRGGRTDTGPSMG